MEIDTEAKVITIALFRILSEMMAKTTLATS